MKIFFKVFIW